MSRRAHSSTSIGGRDRVDDQTKENQPHPDHVLAAKLAGVSDPAPKLTGRNGSGIGGNKLSREEQFSMWKQSRVTSKNALQRNNPNLVRPRTQKDALGKERLAKRGTESEASSEASGRTRLRSAREKDDDDELDESLLNVPNIRGLLDALDDNSMKIRILSQESNNLSQSSTQSTVSSTTSAAKPKMGPIARLQRALAARNSDVESLQMRLAKQISRAERAELEAESRRRDAEEARDQTAAIAKLLDVREDELNAERATVANLQVQLAQAKNEVWTTRRKVEELEADIKEDLGRYGAVVTGLARLICETIGEEADDIENADPRSYENILQHARTLANEFKTRQQNMREEHEGLAAQIESIRTYLQDLESDGHMSPKPQPSPAISLLDKVRHAIDTRNATITRIRDETAALNAELARNNTASQQDQTSASETVAALSQQNEELAEALTTLEADLLTAAEHEQQLVSAVERKEELQTLLMSRDVDVMTLQGELERVGTRVTELENALAAALDENEMLAAAAKVGVRDDSGVGLANGGRFFDNDEDDDDQGPQSPCLRSPGTSDLIELMRCEFLPIFPFTFPFVKVKRCLLIYLHKIVFSVARSWHLPASSPISPT
ncbi:hypothetical protein HDU86_003538 [Geranomyces michiganensis]|nr:hypothetical protein HDU86_003538 [Geranomyces michiganensis]